MLFAVSRTSLESALLASHKKCEGSGTFQSLLGRQMAQSAERRNDLWDIRALNPDMSDLVVALGADGALSLSRSWTLSQRIRD